MQVTATSTDDFTYILSLLSTMGNTEYNLFSIIYIYIYLKIKKTYNAIIQNPLVQIYLISYHHSDFLWYLPGCNRDTLMSNPPESMTGV